jgi:hypothetical protein
MVGVAGINRHIWSSLSALREAINSRDKHHRHGVEQRSMLDFELDLLTIRSN